MDDFNYIKQKLSAFVRKFYLNELLKGACLFLGIWLLYFLIILFIEYFLWLRPAFRSVLFWSFILISLALFYRFIVIPLTKLLKLSKGISNGEASQIIGNHFPEVNDKLLNVLQLQDVSDKSDLLLASISQRSKELKPIPFVKAVNHKTGLRYLQYSAFPIIIFLAVIFTGNSGVFSNSYNRVVHYNTEYIPPAPFYFMIENKDLQTEENNDFTIHISTKGKVVPEEITVHYDGATYYLKKQGNNEFEYTFSNVKNDVQFYLEANTIRSRTYKIRITQVPKMEDFKMNLNFPHYLGRPDEILSGTGNATIPEGSTITWKLLTKTTENVTFSTKDTTTSFVKNGNRFEFKRKLFENTGYSVKTSNKNVQDYEDLEYEIQIIKDQFPQIQLEMKRDSLNNQTLFFYGKVSDDHTVTKVNMVYYRSDNQEEERRTSIQLNSQNYTDFISVFPGELSLENGENYTVYFEVFDNDGVHGAKRAKSDVFQYHVNSVEELQQQRLDNQQQSINGMQENLLKMDFSEQQLQGFSNLEKQKQELSYNDRKKLQDFLKRQEQESELMKNYSQKMKDNLDKIEGNNENDDFKNRLDERLENNEKRLEENEKLLKELEKYSDKIKKEELSPKLEQLAKQQSVQQKNLQQLLELTKKYYVQQKVAKLSNDLQKMAKKQEEIIGKKEDTTLKNQKEIRQEFDKFKKEMDELQQENMGLKKPIKIERDKPEEEEVTQDMEGAEQKLQENDTDSAEKLQKSASEKMEEMAKKMQEMQSMSQGQQLHVDIGAMRQVLDNLLVFSFEEEALMGDFKEMRVSNPSFAAKLRKQQVLKEHFEHIDDSIFSLALSNPMISRKITSKITDIEFNINKALERFSQNEMSQGVGSQQYIMTRTNELANMLDDVLQNMQQMANPSSGKGKSGKQIQLPDIIQSQEELNKQMQNSLNRKNENGKENTVKPNGSVEENMSGKLYEIYKRQQGLRKLLEDKLEKLGLSKSNSDLLNEMKNTEEKMLEKGFSKQNLSRMNTIKERMLKLKDAVREQEESDKRISKTNQKEFRSNTKDQILRAKEYFNSTEILNRQALPLRQIYKDKVKQYFEKGNH